MQCPVPKGKKAQAKGTPPVTDIFREVEEEVRQDHYRKLWEKYGTYIAVAAVVLLVAIGGYRFWQYYETQQALKASDKFQAASALIQANRLDEAQKAYTDLAANAPAGYAELAKFRQAEILIAQGKHEDADKIFRTLTNSKFSELATVARFRLAWEIVDSSPRAEIDSLLAPLTDAKNPWRFAANEVIAYRDLRDGNRDQALASFEKLAAEKTAPDGIRKRALTFVTYLKANPGLNPVRPAAPGALPEKPAASAVQPAALPEKTVATPEQPAATPEKQAK
jgi:hypothetical protein